MMDSDHKNFWQLAIMGGREYKALALSDRTDRGLPQR